MYYTIPKDDFAGKKAVSLPCMCPVEIVAINLCVNNNSSFEGFISFSLLFNSNLIVFEKEKFVSPLLISVWKKISSIFISGLHDRFIFCRSYSGVRIVGSSSKTTALGMEL